MRTGGIRKLVDQAEIHRTAHSLDTTEQKEAVKQLRDNFVFFLDKKQAFEDLIWLTKDKDKTVRWRATETLGIIFPHIIDKKLAWSELVRLTQEDDLGTRSRSVVALGKAFPQVLDKEHAWEDLIRLTKYDESEMKVMATSTLIEAVPYVSDKKHMWQDLIRLAIDEDMNVQREALSALYRAFPYMSDKEKAWKDLISQLEDNVHLKPAAELAQAIPYIYGMDLALEKLIQLTWTFDSSIWWETVVAFGAVFSRIPNKKKAWKKLIRLAEDEDVGMRWRAVVELCNAFNYILDKKQAWEDMHRLTYSKDNGVRWRVADAIGEVFPQIPDKIQAWEDLHRLAKDGDIDVRIYANHSLGRASIFKATEAYDEDNFRKDLETALKFFERSLKEAPTDFNPANFCHPFYQSLYLITFQKLDAEIEVQKYLSKARKAVKGSKTREKLLEAIENLGNALKEAQKVQKMDFNAMKSDLNAYRRYCERAAEMLDVVEEKTPGAARMIRKGLPIIDERIKGIIGEIQERAKALCKETKNTPLEELGKKVNQEGQNLLKVDNPIALYKVIDTMQILLSSICTKMPEEEKEEVCKLLKSAKDEQIVEEKINLINIILGKFSSQRSIVKILENFDKKLSEMIVSLKPGIREEITITVGAEFHGTGLQHVITIPLQEISYSELKEDLEKISEKGLIKLATLPLRLAKKIKDYLIQNKKDELLEVI